MKFRWESLLAPLAIVLILTIAVAAQQQTGQQQGQQPGTTKPTQPKTTDPGAHEEQIQQPGKLADPNRPGAPTRPQTFDDDFDVNRTGMFESYRRHWDSRFNSPEYQAFLKQQQRGPTTTLPPNPEPGLRQQQTNQVRDYEFFAGKPENWMSRRDAMSAWRQSDFYWRRSDMYWRSAERRNDPAFQKYWDTSDQYWRDSERFWDQSFRDFEMEQQRRTQIQTPGDPRRPTDDTDD